MSKADEKKWRAAFRKAVLERDGFKCKVCGFSGDDTTLDPHHITSRSQIANGGYCPENGITLCKVRGFGKLSCHEEAEEALQSCVGCMNEGAAAEMCADCEHGSRAPRQLYKLIGSSYEKAVEAAERLEDA
jgi:hypothetical protein